MDGSSAKRLSALVAFSFCLAGASALFAAQESQTPKVSLSVKHGKSAPLRDYRVQGPVVQRPPREVKNKNLPPKLSAPGTKDAVVQRASGGASPPPAELGQFEGGSDDENEEVIGFRLAPPDTNGDIGPNHYVQYINLIVNIYDRDGNIERGPLPGNVFWDGLGDTCETSNDGDPIVLYDQLAGRWFVSQFAFPNFPGPPYIQCVAVSTTSDPTGAYNQYQFNLPDTYLNDYPKFGIWPDGYYMTFNGFDVFGGGFQGGAIAFDRTAMLAGEPATMIEFNTGEEGGVLPSDLDGLAAPPPGTPNYFLTFNLPPRLIMWAFHADFENPGNSTFTQLSDLPVEDFVTPVCGSFRDQCVPQLDSPELLETLSHATMNRLAYRNFGDHQSLVTNHTVGVPPEGDGANTAGIRWYELQIPGEAAGNGGATNPWVVHQQSTFAPDSNFRWMGSVAQDANGNIALGYSISSAEMFPSIAIAGRLQSDPLNQLGTESIFLEGGGSQSDTSSRWGDYSSMSVDPLDDCTFWYTQEYCQADCTFDWNTRVASFKFPSCVAPDTGTIEGTVTDGANPIEGAIVLAGTFGTTTDASGHYEITLPVGTYDMVVTRYGFFPATADGVEVTDGETTRQDFTLEEAPTVQVNGTVRDSQGGWPLYAQVDVSGPGAPHIQTFSDPVTGYYDVGLLAEGTTYTFVVKALTPGYETGGGTLPLGVPLGNAPFFVKNWLLDADLETCNAPGYALDIHGLFEDFSGGAIPPGWSVENSGQPPWTVDSGADPCGLFDGNDTGGSGPYAIVNSDCDGFNQTADTNLVTPLVNLLGIADPVIRFNSDFSILDIDYPQLGEVDYSTNGGANWTNLFTFDTNLPGPSVHIAALPSAADVQVRFHYEAFWAWWWQLDNVLLGSASCVAGTGGLVVGTVEDVSTGTLLAGATVENVGGGSAKTKDYTPSFAGDPPYYILYAEAGPQTFVASFPNYADDSDNAVVVPNAAVRLDFQLLSGNLTVAPTAFNARVNPGKTTNETLEITNTGGATAPFELMELNVPFLVSTTKGFAPQTLRQEALARIPRKSNIGLKDTKALPRMPLGPTPDGPHRISAAGDVLASYMLDLLGPWGVAYDLGANDFWASDFEYLGGNNYSYRYLPDGTATGDIIDDTSWATANDLIGDGTYNQRTGMLWNVLAGGDQCIYELDPVAKVPTGNTICPDWGGLPFGERGLAYDFATDTFYSGSWEDGVINHFDPDGIILDSKFVALNVSGLAFFPASGHLFVMVNNADEPITVLDAYNNYEVIDSFPVDGFGNFAGAGLEADCAGNLWAVNQNDGKIYKVASGEAGTPGGCSIDIPWLSADPTSGTVPPSAGNGATNPFPITLTFDAGSMLPGLQQAQLAFSTQTPHAVPNVPVTLTVRFLDVPDENIFEAYIYGVAGAGVMFGGPPVCAPGVLYFCPDGFVTRADMAGYLWRAINGRNTPPPVYQNIFSDVTFNDYNSFYIQGIYDLGVTAGCEDGTKYCPNVPVTRAQMSALVWRGLHGEEPPPACTPPGVFADVPCPSLFADYIEALAAEGVTAGCGGGNFCPHQPISNGQMAVFLAKAYGIPVLLP